MICHIKCTLYNLKQFPRAWFGCFSDIVQKYEMICSKVDHLVFYHHSPSKGSIYLVYVDGIIIIGHNHEGIVRLKKHHFGHF